jgi:hypothetical protein
MIMSAGSYSKREYPLNECPEKVTVRVLPDKLQVYPRFRDLVTQKLGSDVCFVTTSLWEAFLIGMDQLPPADEQLEMKFLRQNVQINIGCQITYQPTKARRFPPKDQLPLIQISKNQLLPGLLDEWKTLDAAAKRYWRKRFREAGIIQPRRRRNPSVSTGKRKRKNYRAWGKMEQSMTNASKRMIIKAGRLLRRLKK